MQAAVKVKNYWSGLECKAMKDSLASSWWKQPQANLRCPTQTLFACREIERKCIFSYCWKGQTWEWGISTFWRSSGILGAFWDTDFILTPYACSNREAHGLLLQVIFPPLGFKTCVRKRDKCSKPSGFSMCILLLWATVFPNCRIGTNSQLLFDMTKINTTKPLIHVTKFQHL